MTICNNFKKKNALNKCNNWIHLNLDALTSTVTPQPQRLNLRATPFLLITQKMSKGQLQQLHTTRVSLLPINIAGANCIL